MWHRGFEPSCRAAPATATLNQFRDFCERAPGGPAHPPMRLLKALLGLHTGRVRAYRLRAFPTSRGAGCRRTIRTESVRKVTCKFLRHSGTARLDALKTQNLKVSGICPWGKVFRPVLAGHSWESEPVRASSHCLGHCRSTNHRGTRPR